MLDEKSFELLNGEIDGTLSAAERAELSRRLLESPELRAVRDDLRHACAELGRLPEAEPPAGLRESILAHLPSTGGATEARSRHGFAMAPRALRFAAAIVGGVLVSVIAFEASRGLVNPAAEQLTGTMAHAPLTAAPDGTLRVETTAVRGLFRLTPQADGVAVSFQPDAPPSPTVGPDALEITATRGGRVTQLAPVAALQQGNAAEFSALLPGAVTTGELVRIQIEAAGVPVFAGQWQAPAGH